MTKIYLAHSISTRGEFEDSKRVANEIRALGYDVYAAAENASINDKTNNPSPLDIYNGDVPEIIDADIFVVNLSGGLQDGTISEAGAVAGWNEALEVVNKFLPNIKNNVITIIAYTSNARLTNPQFSHGIASASANHLVLGMIEKWGTYVGAEETMLEALKERKGDD